jgi:hypothetical protein
MISQRSRKGISQNSTLIHDLKINKSLKKPGIKVNFHNLIRSIYEKFTSNILLGERVSVFPLRSIIRPDYLLSPVLFNILLGPPTKGSRPKKGDKKSKR